VLQDSHDIIWSEFDQLLLQARTGCKEALGEMLESLRLVLLQAARRQVPSYLQSKCAPEDLVQDTFLEAQRSLGQFEGKTELELGAWLGCILRHTLADLVRAYRNRAKRQVAREISLDESHASAELRNTLIAPGPAPANEAVRQEEGEKLNLAVSNLPRAYRQVVWLRARENLSFEEIGALIGRSGEAARKIWSRAARELRKEYSKDSIIQHKI